VSISLARAISEQVRPPRVYCLRYPFGHPLGEPFAARQQRRILLDALSVLETAQQPGTIVDSPYHWRHSTFE
jgi:D-proline reductase (dithiol) PrdB